MKKGMKRPRGPLPEDVRRYLLDLLRRPEGETHEQFRHRYQRLAGYRDLVKEAGWSSPLIAQVVGLSRQAVDQWGSGVADRAGHPEVPPPPVPVPPPSKPMIAEEDARRMRRLVPAAGRVNGKTSSDSPLVEAGKELAELMAGHVRAGFSINAVATAAGVSRNAVAFRLARYGYNDCIPVWTRDYVERTTGVNRYARVD